MLISNIEGASLLHAGQIIAVPTDTIYGLAARADLKDSVEELFSLKRRTNRKPLVILVSSFEQLYSFVEKNHLLMVIPWLKMWWPGPCTVIFPAKNPSIAERIGSTNGCIGVRIPANEDMLWLLEKVGPLVVSSANISGKFPATKNFHIEADFGDSLFYMNESTDQLCGLESTVIQWTSLDVLNVLREGWLTIETIQKTWKGTIKISSIPTCFITNKTWIWGKSLEENNKFVSIGFSNGDLEKRCTFYWGPFDCVTKVAKEFYSVLRLASESSDKNIYIDSIWPSGSQWNLMLKHLSSLCDNRCIDQTTFPTLG